MATLSTGYSEYGNGFAKASYEKDLLGFVHLRGTVSCPTGEALAFMLPAGYRPSSNLFLPNAGGSSIEVETGGDVVTSSSFGTCALDGFSFPAAGTAGAGP